MTMPTYTPLSQGGIGKQSQRRGVAPRNRPNYFPYQKGKTRSCTVEATSLQRIGNRGLHHRYLKFSLPLSTGEMRFPLAVFTRNVHFIHERVPAGNTQVALLVQNLLSSQRTAVVLHQIGFVATATESTVFLPAERLFSKDVFLGTISACQQHKHIFGHEREKTLDLFKTFLVLNAELSEDADQVVPKYIFCPGRRPSNLPFPLMEYLSASVSRVPSPEPVVRPDSLQSDGEPG